MEQATIPDRVADAVRVAVRRTALENDRAGWRRLAKILVGVAADLTVREGDPGDLEHVARCIEAAVFLRDLREAKARNALDETFFENVLGVSIGEDARPGGDFDGLLAEVAAEAVRRAIVSNELAGTVAGRRDLMQILTNLELDFSMAGDGSDIEDVMAEIGDRAA